MNSHVLSFRNETLVPGWAECIRCGRVMKLAEYLTTPCEPRPKEERNDVR